MADPRGAGTVFVSYSHEDEQWLKRLSPYLAQVERDGVSVSIWDDREIAPGQPWKATIQQAIEMASVAVLLISQHFLASKFIHYEELPALLRAAKDGGLTILPVILSPCQYERTSGLGDLQAVNSLSRTLKEMTEAEQDRVFTRLVDQIIEALIKPFREIDAPLTPLKEMNDLDEKQQEFLERMRKLLELDGERMAVLDRIVAMDERRARAAAAGQILDKADSEPARLSLQEELRELNKRRRPFEENLKVPKWLEKLGTELRLSPREIFRRAPDRPQQYAGKRVHWRVFLFRKEDLEHNKVRLACFPVHERALGNTIFANVARSPEVDLLERDAVFMLDGQIAELIAGGVEISDATVSKIEGYGRRR